MPNELASTQIELRDCGRARLSLPSWNRVENDGAEVVQASAARDSAIDRAVGDYLQREVPTCRKLFAKTPCRHRILLHPNPVRCASACRTGTLGTEIFRLRYLVCQPMSTRFVCQRASDRNLLRNLQQAGRRDWALLALAGRADAALVDLRPSPSNTSQSLLNQIFCSNT
jgi:hypothetical protein